MVSNRGGREAADAFLKMWIVRIPFGLIAIAGIAGTIRELILQKQSLLALINTVIYVGIFNSFLFGQVALTGRSQFLSLIFSGGTQTRTSETGHSTNSDESGGSSSS